MTKADGTSATIMAPAEEGRYHLYVVNTDVAASEASLAILTVLEPKQTIEINSKSWEWISFNVDVEDKNISNVILNPIDNLYIKGKNNFSKYSETEHKWIDEFTLKNNSGYKVYNPSDGNFPLEIAGEPILL